MMQKEEEPDLTSNINKDDEEKPKEEIEKKVEDEKIQEKVDEVKP